MKNKRSTFILIITVMLFAVAMTLAGLAVFLNASDYSLVKSVPEEEPEKDYDLSKIEMIDDLIKQTYLKEYDRENQMETVCRDMLDSLDDPYSRYLSAEELKQLQQSINSSFTGTGIGFIEQEDPDKPEGFIVTEVITGGPASIAGVKEDDIIQTIDGIKPKSTDELVNMLKGDPGTKVDIKVMRDEEELELSVVRGEVSGGTVDSKRIKNENIGYIKIRSFGSDTYTLFEPAIAGFEKDGTDGVIVDLRDNSGGLFDEGLKVVDRILPECLISYTVDKSGEKENFNSDDYKTALNIAVLVNENTASTAEMVAAALGLNGVTLVGEKTYGKGLMQETHMYDDGSAVNITTKEFFVGNDVKIDGVGVSPDVIISNSLPAVDSQLEKAVEIIKGK